MLGKNLILTTFCVLLLFDGVEAAWEKVQVKSILSSDQYILTDGRQVSLFGVKGLELYSPELSEKCLTESTKLQLKHLLFDYDLKIKVVESDLVYLRFGTNDLGAFLVSQGLATAHHEKYLKPQSEAQKNHKGRWGQCDPHLNIIKWQKKRGRTPWFWDRYHTYLSSPSVGRVIAVLSGNLLVLENGLRVQLQDIVVPEVSDIRDSYQCFAKKSQEYLENLVLGQKVYIEHQYNLLPKYKTITRQVYLPQTRSRNTVWLNRAMIQAGYGKLNPDSENESLIKVQEQVWDDPMGAWKECVASLTKERQGVGN